MTGARITLQQVALHCDVKPATVRKWVERGHITRYWNGYDVFEVLHWIDTIRDRNMAELATRPRPSVLAP